MSEPTRKPELPPDLRVHTEPRRLRQRHPRGLARVGADQGGVAGAKHNPAGALKDQD
jgi:hypothetical protein